MKEKSPHALIRCTVAVLTKNSGKTLDKALASVKDFSDIVICDGGSTDDTLAIAARYGARVIRQDLAYLDGEGRLADFAAVRNQCLEAAQEPWFFFLDSDEYISDGLAAEIRAVVAGKPGAYWVPRKYVLDEKVIDCAVSYPNRQLRLFHRELAERFVKPVHERILLKAGTAESQLTAPLFVPVVDDMPAQLEDMAAHCPQVQLFEMRRDGGAGDGRWPVIRSLAELP